MSSINDWIKSTGRYVVDLNLVLQSDTLMPVTRWMAGKIIENQYISIGEILFEISIMPNYQLESLLIAAETYEDGGEGDHNIVLMTIMLSAAEGLPIESLSILHQNTGFFIIYLTVMALEQKDMAHVYYENLTFDDSLFNDKVMFEKL